ncbi:two-component system, OmpR family, sensor histidine kinase MprB [Actinacidiphila rubida]|uniref:histidine kinase n=2 Tax=Actinacidiphila rubida TaxID=310780 RepID=A0A1H8P5C0_9ACTN|nr:HAMP domain-containing sensor histidine kinase [Actinacidiphila rubida]SEO37052.1 two-component system, OmpR family, sensor histidine kinase MprB [Actinacidiphila rubida]
MNRLPLRSRLALLTAAAVAVAVAAAALACWFITRGQLTSQLDSSLTAVRPNPEVLSDVARAPDCPAQPTGGAAPNVYTVQLIASDGSVCTVVGKSPIPASSSDIQVANGQKRDTVHSATAKDGTRMRVFTYRDHAGGVRFTTSVAQPLTEIDHSLNRLAWLLLAVAGFGVLGAASAGAAIARAGLRPVDRLTDTVEHIARTEDLNVRIPVEGQDEIARLSASFNAMTAALASSRERQSQLIADAGHELRTPLTSLRTNIELLERSEATGRAIPPEDRKALLASVKAQMTELAALIGDLQELSRPDASHVLSVVPLHEVTETALSRARLRGPDLKIVADVAPWYVRGEAAALERAIVNLMDNAVKFSPSGGVIEVRLHGGRLTVRDHGPGIPSEDLPHVFERFWRSPSARSLPGSGLGLSIVARTVQQSGGEVSLTPADGGGTLAVLQLPGAPTPPPDEPLP